MRVAADPTLTEDRALGLLKEAGVSGDALEVLPNNKQLMKSRKVRLALVMHPKTPRHVSVPALRQLFMFDLMNVALAPLVPADVKMVAEDVLILKMERFRWASGCRWLDGPLGGLPVFCCSTMSRASCELLSKTEG